jgi:hypothetical protein
VNGVADIVPGVRVVPTPGHTPGHQSVAVNTEDGVVMIAGDCANCMENIVDLVPVGIVHETAPNCIRSSASGKSATSSFQAMTPTSCLDPRASDYPQVHVCNVSNARNGH